MSSHSTRLPSAQRLSLISGTLALAVPDLLHFAVVCGIIACMFGLLACTVFGYRVGSASSAQSAVTQMIQYVVLQTDDGMMAALVERSVERETIESLLAWLLVAIGPLLFRFVLANFIMAILAR